MGTTMLYIWLLLSIALRVVTALHSRPQPQEPLLPTQSTPAAPSAESANLPLVIWHGLGDKYAILFPASCRCADSL